MLRIRVTGVCALALVAALASACAESDPGITTAVKSKLAADDAVKSYRIDVDTRDRVVTLNGAVDTPAAKARAVEIARGTDGVRDVVDELVVTPGATPTTGMDDAMGDRPGEAVRGAGEAGREAGRDVQGSAREGMERARDAAPDVNVDDAAITAKVKASLLGDTRVSGLRIDVDTRSGVVTLTGTVPTAAEKARAVQLARAAEGVRSVEDKLKVGKRDQ